MSSTSAVSPSMRTLMRLAAQTPMPFGFSSVSVMRQLRNKKALMLSSSTSYCSRKKARARWMGTLQVSSLTISITSMLSYRKGKKKDSTKSIEIRIFLWYTSGVRTKTPEGTRCIAFCKAGGRASFQKHFGSRNRCILLLRTGSFFYYQNLEERK